MGARYWLVAAGVALVLLHGTAAAELESQSTAAAGDPLPVVIWHGMGDSCCDPNSMGAVQARIEQAIPGAYVLSLRFGATDAADREAGYIGNVNDQVAAACATITADGNLSRGYNAVGFSQGGQFLRGVAQRCRHRGAPPMRTLITLGSQHQGVAALPGCNVSAPDAATCQRVAALVGNDGAFAPWVRDHVVQAQYYKNPASLEKYAALSAYLADINNEALGRFNASYGAALASLERLVLFRFSADATVVPRDSAWFSWWDGSRVVPLQEQRMWALDTIGLRRLALQGRLVFAEAPGEHMQFTLDWFEEAVIAPYLAPRASDTLLAADGTGAAAQAQRRRRRHRRG